MKHIIQHINERLKLNKDSKVIERKINFKEFIKLIDGKSKYGKFKSNLFRGIAPKYPGKIGECYYDDCVYYYVLFNWLILKIQNWTGFTIVISAHERDNYMQIKSENLAGINFSEWNTPNPCYFKSEFIDRFIKLLDELYEMDSGDDQIELIKKFDKECKNDKLYIKRNEND